MTNEELEKLAIKSKPCVLWSIVNTLGNLMYIRWDGKYFWEQGLTGTKRRLDRMFVATAVTAYQKVYDSKA